VPAVALRHFRFYHRLDPVHELRWAAEREAYVSFGFKDEPVAADLDLDCLNLLGTS
jgi:hypothetical protein